MSKDRKLAATYENPWPDRVDAGEARSIVAEFVAGCSTEDIALLYASAARKPVALTWEGREYLCYGPEGREWASLERAKKERAAFPEVLRELKRILLMWEEAIGWEPNYMDMADRARDLIARLDGKNEECQG